MDREGLEHRSRLHSLEAENKHLKSLLNRVATTKNDTDVKSSSLLLSEIELLFEGDYKYGEVIYPVLKKFGETVGVDRISIFTFDSKEQCFYSTKQWANDHIQEYHPFDLSFSKTENPLNTPTQGACFASSNIQNDIQKSLAEKLAIFQVQSVLVVPFKWAEFPEAMLVFESCYFNREWYGFEVEEIVSAIGVFSNRLHLSWQNNQVNQVLQLGDLRHKVSVGLSAGKKTKKSVNEIFQLLGSQLGFNSIYVAEKDISPGHGEMSWVNSPEDEERRLSDAELEKLTIGSDKENWFYFTPSSLHTGVLRFSMGDNALVVSRVTIQNEYRGWLIGELSSSHTYSETIFKQFWEFMSLMVSGVLSSIDAENRFDGYKYRLQELNNTLAVKESFVKHLLDDAPVGILLVSNELVQYANDHFLSDLGYDLDEIRGISLPDSCISPDPEFENSLAQFYSAIGEHDYASSEITLNNKQGELKRISLYGSKDVAGEEKSFLVFAVDVTENHFAKKEIQESHERYQKILEATVDGVVILNKSGSIQSINQSFCSLLGYTVDEAMQLKYTDFICKDHHAVFQRIFTDLDLGKDFKGDSVLCKKNNSFLEAEVCAVLIQLEGADHYFFSIHDISARKRNEKIIAEREIESRSLAENSPDIILRLNKGGQILFFNPALTDQFKFLQGNDVLGYSLQDLQVLDSYVGSTWQAKVSDVFSSGEKLSMELGFSDEKKELYYDWKLSPEINNEGEVETILAVGRNLTLRKTAEKQLLLAKQKAEESDKLKSAFLSNISHELRTPLNAIVGFSALLRGEDVLAQEKDEYIDVIHKNSDSLLNLVNNIIDVAKIESGKISVVKETVSVDALMLTLYDSFLPKVEIEHKGRVKLYCNKPKGDGLEIETDPIRLKQVMVNLLENAIKFTVKGFVEFGYSLQNGELRFFVKDTGIGISEAKQSLIFQPFRKEDESNNQLFGGTGIGLPISEKLINALGGSIGLVSEKGQGSEFFFTHPMEIKKQEEKRVEDMRRIYNFSNPMLPKSYQWQNKLVLMVDENSGAHLQMRKFIEKTGLTLVSARTAAGASKLLMNRSDIHLVLMDLNFPDSDGYELVRIIKAQNKNVPVIAHSLKAFNGERERLLQSGFDACISKPTEKDELLMVMDKFLIEADTK